MDLIQLDEEQKIALKQFSDSVSDCKLVDSSQAYLLKWLVARSWDVKQAEIMLRQMLEWRRLNKVDGMLETWTPPEVMRKYYSAGFSGQDKDGCPVWIQAFTRTDFKGLLASVGRKDFLRYVTYHNEIGLRELERLRKKNGKIVTQHTLIMDMENLGMRTLTYREGIEIQVETIKSIEHNYPDNYRRVFVVNAPKLFTIFYPMIKPFISPITASKFRFYGCDRDQWKAALLTEIDADQLPIHYGGTLADPDGNPMYLTKICMGGEVPKCYYMNKNRTRSTENMKSATIARGTSMKLEFQVKDRTTTLMWKFFSEEGDVGFHIFYKEGDRKVDLVPMARIDCHVVPEEGRIVCPRPVTYFVEFDNSFSYLRSKKIWFDVRLESP